MDQISTSPFTFSQLLLCILIENHPSNNPLLEAVIKPSQLMFANDSTVKASSLILQPFHLPFDCPPLKSSLIIIFSP